MTKRKNEYIIIFGQRVKTAIKNGGYEMETKIVNGKNGIVCLYCGATKPEVIFVIGACSKDKPDWCMIYGTGKMACPACYEKASAEGVAACDKVVTDRAAEVAAARLKEKPAREVPAAVKSSLFGCMNCLWASIECKNGSNYVETKRKAFGNPTCEGYTDFD